MHPDDPMRRRLERLRRISDSAAARSDLYKDVAKAGHGTVSDGSLKYLRSVSAPGKKIQKIGFIMLWIPEPTGVTCAVGAPMILAGRYLEKRYNSSTIHEIGHVTKNTITTMRGL